MKSKFCMNFLSIDQGMKTIPYFGDGTIREDGDANYGFKNIKSDLSLIESIPELAEDASLKSLVRAINDPQTSLFSTGCVGQAGNDDNGYKYAGYVEFALNSKDVVKDASSYFHFFFHFDSWLNKRDCQLTVKFDWELQPAHFIEANVFGFTCAIIINTPYSASLQEAHICWKEALELLEKYLGSIRLDGDPIYPPPQ